MVNNHSCNFYSLNESNLKEFIKLNQGVLPVSYPKAFYNQLLKYEYSVVRSNPESLNGNDLFFTQLAIDKNDKDELIGGICCKLEKMQKSEATIKYQMCILTFAVAPSYRRRGIGSILLQRILDRLDEFKQETNTHVESIYLHLQSSNDDALQFYNSQGFQITEKISEYYKRLEEPECYVLTKCLN